MAEYGPAPQYGPLGQWNPPARKRVSVVLLTIALVLMIAGAVVYFLAPASAATMLWIAFVLLVVVLLFELAVLFSGLAAEGSAPAWLGRMFGSGAATASASGAPMAAEAVVDRYPPVDLKCPECENVFTARDTGERPLRTTCPHCGAEGLVDLPPPEPVEAAPAYAAPSTPARPNPVITLRCPACSTQFSVEDDGTRPLRAVCPGCGRSGRLR